MTREIKFRAWDISNNEMYQVGTLEFEKATGDLATTYDPVMQYIGLKDKNSKEIYEGDILGYPNDSNGVIIWDNVASSFRLKFSDNDQVMISLQIGDKGMAKVIGNIYQDKELLQGGCIIGK